MDTFLKKLKEVWYIIVMICGLVVWYANVNTRLDTVEAKQKDQQVTLDKIDQLSIDMAVVKNDVSYIKQTIAQ